MGKTREGRWPMIWLVGAGVLALVVAVVIVVGALLPAEHEVTRWVRVRRTPEEVWGTLTDVEAFPSWRPRLARVELLTPEGGRPRWREVGKDGAITFELVEADVPRRLVTRIADASLPFGGSWTFVLQADDGGCLLTVTERGEVRNVVYRFMSRFVLGHTATIDAYLRGLGVTYGESVTPRAATEEGV